MLIEIDNFKVICDKLHGYLPIINEQGQEEIDMHNETYEIMQQIFPGKSEENKCFIRLLKVSYSD